MYFEGMTTNSRKREQKNREKRALKCIFQYRNLTKIYVAHVPSLLHILLAHSSQLFSFKSMLHELSLYLFSGVSKFFKSV